MLWKDRLRSLERAMEDIEDPRGTVRRDFVDHLKSLDEQRPPNTAGEER